MGHSTGGLIAALWAADHPERVAGVVLNSPWLDLQGSAMVRALGGPVIDAVGGNRPTAALPLPDSGFYARTIHVDQEGEWDYDTELKTSPSPADPGGLAAGGPAGAPEGRRRSRACRCRCW